MTKKLAVIVVVVTTVVVVAAFGGYEFGRRKGGNGSERQTAMADAQEIIGTYNATEAGISTTSSGSERRLPTSGAFARKRTG